MVSSTLASDDNSVYSVNAATGTKIWSFKTAGKVFSSPAVSDGVVYVGSDDGSVYALNAVTGVQIWNYKTGGSVFSSPTVSNGIVYYPAASVYVTL